MQIVIQLIIDLSPLWCLLLFYKYIRQTPQSNALDRRRKTTSHLWWLEALPLLGIGSVLFLVLPFLLGGFGILPVGSTTLALGLVHLAGIRHLESTGTNSIIFSLAHVITLAGSCYIFTWLFVHSSAVDAVPLFIFILSAVILYRLRSS
jgi:hypothetical protein